MRSTFVRALFLVLAAAGLAALVAPAASAAPAARYCYTQVAPSAKGSHVLVPVAQTCSDRAKPGTVLPENATLAAQQLLVVFHQDVNYHGAYTTVGGSVGPCDATGYSFSDLTTVENNVQGVSSYEYSAGSNCHSADYFTGTNFTGPGRFGYAGNNPSVGPTWDNRVYSMKVRA